MGDLTWDGRVGGERVKRKCGVLHIPSILIALVCACQNKPVPMPVPVPGRLSVWESVPSMEELGHGETRTARSSRCSRSPKNADQSGRRRPVHHDPTSASASPDAGHASDVRLSTANLADTRRIPSIFPHH